MSASDKKKLRKEQMAAAMTERQRKELKESKKLKAYTISFVVVMALIVATVIGIVVTPIISGSIDRRTQAVTIGDTTLSSADLNYYYIDAINSYVNNVYSTYSGYGNLWAYFLGFDYSKPLNKQVYDKEKNTTWADYFVERAIKSATETYALYEKAQAEGHELSETEQKGLDSTLSSIKAQAKNNHVSANKQIQITYGTGATLDSYMEYTRVSLVASSYYSKFVDSLKYEDKDLREYEKDKFNDYSSFNYYTYYVQVSKYLEGGTKSEDGKTTTYSDAEKAAALEKAKADVEALLKDNINNKDQFNQAIKALAINKNNTSAACTENLNTFYSRITNEDIQKWVSNEDRVKGEITSVESINETKNDKGEVTSKETVGFFIVLFESRNDNKTNLIDVRHILVKFPTVASGSKLTDAQKKETKDKAEAILNTWKGGKADEDSFAALAKEKTEDAGSKSNGGLYTDVYPNMMVEAFNDWCFDEARKSGDTDIIETEYGYHIMYFVNTKDETYRDAMIKSDLINRDSENWVKELTEKVKVTKLDLTRLELDYTLG